MQNKFMVMDDPILEALNRRAEEMTPEDIDRVIAYLRKGHQAHEKGEKGAKPDASNLLATLGLKAGPQTVGLKRRI